MGIPAFEFASGVVVSVIGSSVVVDSSVVVVAVVVSGATADVVGCAVVIATPTGCTGILGTV